MTQPQQPFGHVSEPWPAQVGRLEYGPPRDARTFVDPVAPLAAQIAALTARVAAIERRLAEITREERA